MIKLDMHVHTVYSKYVHGDPFACIDLKTLKKFSEKNNIIPIVTDHNTTKAYKKLKLPIMGEEITSSEGHIIGLFLQEEIKQELSKEETIDKIREQDGLVYIPHPFDWLRFSLLWHTRKVKPDIIEVFNSKCFSGGNGMALRYAREKNILMGAGSDAHFPFQLGDAFIEIEEFNSKKEFLKNLKKAKGYGNIFRLRRVF